MTEQECLRSVGTLVAYLMGIAASVGILVGALVGVLWLRRG